MAVINLTPDSFYPASRCSGTAAVLRVQEALQQGADIIDMGACSTRPGASWVPEEEEWRRLEPVLEETVSRFPGVCLSIDTFRSGIVEKVFGLVKREFYVNDISAGEEDPQLLACMGHYGLPWIAMHKRGNSKTMLKLCHYANVIDEVKACFALYLDRARRFGINRVILDPGFGFAKTAGQDLQLMTHLERLRMGDVPLLAGISRKRTTWEPYGMSPQEALPLTTALHLQLLLKGVDILRVHDVKEAVAVIKLAASLEEAGFTCFDGA